MGGGGEKLVGKQERCWAEFGWHGLGREQISREFAVQSGVKWRAWFCMTSRLDPKKLRGIEQLLQLYASAVHHTCYQFYKQAHHR